MLQYRPYPKRAPDAPDYHDLVKTSVAFHEQWAERLAFETDIDVGFVRCGSLELVSEERATQDVLEKHERMLEGAQERGVRVSRLTAVEAAEIEPGLSTAGLQYALHYPDDAQFRNPRFLKATALSCRMREATIREGINVAEVWVDGGRARGVIAGDGTRYEAGQTVICVGAWTAQIEALTENVRRAGKIKPVKGQIVCYDLREKLCSNLLTHGDRYLVPRPDGVLLVGSTSEKVGFDGRTTPEGQAALRGFAESMLPAIKGIEPTMGWADLRPGLNGLHPIMGPVPEVEGLYMAAGHYRNGLCLAPVTAEIISAYVSGREPPVAADPWRPR